MESTTQTTRFEAAIAKAQCRMDAIQHFLYWNATRQPGAVMTEGAFFDGGPVCLIATLPSGRQYSTIKARFAVDPSWVAGVVREQRW